MQRPATLYPYLTLRDTPGALILRERARPVLAAVWCYGLMALICGGASWSMERSGGGRVHRDETVFLWVFGVLGFLIASGLVGAETWKACRKPLLTFDRTTGRVSLPRLELSFAVPSEVFLGWREEVVALDEGEALADVLYLCQPLAGPPPVKIGTEYHAGALLPLLERLAEASGIRVGSYSPAPEEH